MASTWLLGFAKGFGNSMAQSLDYERKARLAEQLWEERQRKIPADTQIEGNEFVVRNAHGEVLSKRPATPQEIENFNLAKERQQLEMNELRRQEELAPLERRALEAQVRAGEAGASQAEYETSPEMRDLNLQEKRAGIAQTRQATATSAAYGRQADAMANAYGSGLIGAGRKAAASDALKPTDERAYVEKTQEIVDSLLEMAEMPPEQVPEELRGAFGQKIRDSLIRTEGFSPQERFRAVEEIRQRALRQAYQGYHSTTPQR